MRLEEALNKYHKVSHAHMPENVYFYLVKETIYVSPRNGPACLDIRHLQRTDWKEYKVSQRTFFDAAYEVRQNGGNLKSMRRIGWNKNTQCLIVKRDATDDCSYVPISKEDLEATDWVVE